MFPSSQTDRCCNLLHGKHVGMVFQRRKINNHSTPSRSRERGRSLQRSPIVRVFQVSRDLRSFPRLLLWRLPFSLTLSPPSVAAIRRLPLFFFCLPHPPPFSPSPSPYTFQSASVVSADCWAVGREEKGISRVLEFW